MKNNDIDLSMISIRLKMLVVSNNMSQHDLSNLTNISETCISRYINGARVPGTLEIIKLSKALNVSTDYLLGLSEDFNESEKETIDVEKILSLCEKNASKWHELILITAENMDYSNPDYNVFNAFSYATEQEKFYRYEIPNIIKKLKRLSDLI